MHRTLSRPARPRWPGFPPPRPAGPPRAVARRVVRLTRALAAAVLLVLCAVEGASGQTGGLDVRVTGSGDVPVMAAAVTARASAPGATTVVREAVTNALGLARFDGLAAGSYTVRVERIGFETTKQRAVVLAGRNVALHVVLQESALNLPRLLVEADRTRARFEENAGASVTELTRRDVKLVPAVGEADVLRAVEILPGVISTSDFSSSFNVRGGSADQNLILLDGLPIYNPFHLGGVFSIFNADMVGRVEMQAGGFPARYGGRVSSVLSVETDPGEPGTDVQAGVSVLATRAALGVDLPSAPLAAAGLGAGRMRVSLRRSYFDQLFKPFFDFPYHLTDAQFHAEAWSGAGDRVTVTGYTGRDILDLSGAESFPLRLRWSWGNDVVGAGWTHPFGGGAVGAIRVGHTRFATDIRFPEFDDTEFRSRISQTLLRADVTGRPGSFAVDGGVAADFKAYDNLATTGGTEFGSGAEQGTLLGAYVQTRWRRDRLLVETGVRVDGWLPASDDAITVVQPRLAVKRFVGAGDVAVRLSVGRYAQFVQSLRDEELPLGIDVWVLAGRRAPHVVSDQVQAGIEGFVGESWFAAADAYVRRFRGVATFNAADDPNDPLDDLLRGTGLSRGADFHVRRESGTIRPMLAVSWLRATREFEDVYAAVDPPPRLRYAPIFDRRLDVDFVLQAMLPRSVELGIRWHLGTGLPYTRPEAAYVFYEYSQADGRWRWPGADSARSAIVLGGRNAERYPSYHRLDAGVRRTFTRRWGTITPYVDVLNLYNRRNVLFYFYQYDTDPPTRAGISMFPLLPTVGFEARF